jgi:ABC-type branched-subunit amino acid transport system ATPase component
MVCVKMKREEGYPAMFRPALEVQSISKTSDARAIEDLSFTVGVGEVMGIFGDPGTGKSTLISVLAGDASPDSGRILLNGEEITQLSRAARAQRGMSLIQSPHHLFSELTAFENIVLLSEQHNGPFFPRQGGTAYGDEARAALELVGLTECADRKVETFCPAQRHLLAIAIGLSESPSLLLLNDPWGVGVTTRSILPNALLRIACEGISVLFTALCSQPVTEICHRITVLPKGTTTAPCTPPSIVPEPVLMQGYMGYAP